MNAVSPTHPELATNTKTLVHSISLLLLPVILFIAIFIGNSPKGQLDTAQLMGIVIGFVLTTCYITFLYFLAGGFDWHLEKLSTIRVILFFLLSGLIYGLILYGYWYLVRFVMAKASGLPFSNIKGQLLTRKTQTNEENIDMQNNTSSNNLWRWAPIIMALTSLGIVGAIGVSLTTTDVYLRDPNADPGKGIGTIALIVSLVVFYITKQWIDKKTKE